ncbi:MAG TPA: MFS transporter [Planctomycetota bacterium]|nr:MFS transporter [Planctomycetota bacterium]
MENAQPIPFLKTRLSVQMFLQFAIWGAWVPVMGRHLQNLGFSGEQVGYVMTTGAIATMISPLIGGQIVDRYFASQRYLAFSFIASAVMFVLAAVTTEYERMWWLALMAMIFFAPTLGLANSLSFHHLPDAQRDFPKVRLWGTVGWIAAGLVLWAWLEITKRGIGDCLFIAAGFAVLNGIYCLTLPHTPPKKEAAEPFAVGKVLAMLKDPSFLVFNLLAFLLMMFATFYYFQSAMFLPTLGITDQNLTLVLGTGQVLEILTMFALPWALRTLGTKYTIAIGLGAWSLRFFAFSLGSPAWLVVASQSLHGVAFAFALAGSMIYIEKISAPDVRGSMQSFLAFLTYGVGMFVGGIVGGKVNAHYTTKQLVNGEQVSVTDWSSVWLVPAIGCAAVTLVFLLAFTPRDSQKSA